MFLNRLMTFFNLCFQTYPFIINDLIPAVNQNSIYYLCVKNGPFLLLRPNIKHVMSSQKQRGSVRNPKSTWNKQSAPNKSSLVVLQIWLTFGIASLSFANIHCNTFAEYNLTIKLNSLYCYRFLPTYTDAPNFSKRCCHKS